MIYAEGSTDEKRRDLARAAISEIGTSRILLPLQAAGETLHWLIRKGGLTKSNAAKRVETWLELFTVIPTTRKIFQLALNLVSAHDFQLWEAIIIAASADAGATYLLSEDMQHGFMWSTITILNPFALSQNQMTALINEIPIH